MKTFNELTVGDCIYEVLINSMNYKEQIINEIKGDTIYFGSRDHIPRWKVPTNEVISNYRSEPSYVYFANKTDCLRYCKAQMMKTLFHKIDTAKSCIEEIRKFRLENYELLNHEWTENQINLLEKELNY